MGFLSYSYNILLPRYILAYYTLMSLASRRAYLGLSRDSEVGTTPPMLGNFGLAFMFRYQVPTSHHAVTRKNARLQVHWHLRRIIRRILERASDVS